MKYSKIFNVENCRYILSIFTIFALIAILDSLIFGLFVINEVSVNVDSLWREKDGIFKFLPLTILVYLILSFTIVTLFKDFVTESKKGLSLMNFLKAGLLIGLLIGVVFLGFYVMFPFNFSLVFVCFAGSLIFGILAGLILYFFNK